MATIKAIYCHQMGPTTKRKETEHIAKYWHKIEQPATNSSMWRQTDINWSPLINLIIQLYLKNTTLCVIWHPDTLYNLNAKDIANPCAVINIYKATLPESFDRDIEDFRTSREKFEENGLMYNDLTEKLTMSIEKSHCESFLVFEEDILPFIQSFINASQYSGWRSKRNRFVFATSNETEVVSFQRHSFFEDHPNLLVILAHVSCPDMFDLKTNKFRGTKADQQNTLLQLDRFFLENVTFLHNLHLFPDKIRNLQGREVVLAGFDYRPYLIINYVKDENNSYDLAYGSSPEGRVQIDGTEARVILTFCEIHNCTVLIDSSDANDWGEVYSNLSGDASLGMVTKGTAEISVGAMYSWDFVYIVLDMSMYLVRSGVTCLVPAPKRLASWLLPLEPFQFTLWLAVVAYLIVEMLSLSLMHRFETWHIAPNPGSWRQSLRYGCVTALKLFVSQSGSGYVYSQTVRVLLFTCFMNDLIITSIYEGGLASILTVPSYEEAADTVDRMLSHKVKWAANSEAWIASIRNTDDDRMNGILDNFFQYPDEMLQRLAVTRHDFGFPVERLPFGHFAIGDYLTPESINHLKIMQEDLYFQYTVAFVARCWPLLAQFDELIYWWHSAGLDSYWEWRVVADNMNVQKQKQVEATMYSNMQDDTGPVKLGMSNFVGILLIWVLGITMSLMAFIYELLSDYAKRRAERLLKK